MRAFSGLAIGTSITSMLKSDVFGSSFGSLPEQPDQLFTRAHAARARGIQEDVALVLRIGNQRVRVRAAAGLHRRDLLRILQVGDVEDADAAEALVADRRHHALQAAVEPAAGLFDRHEQQVAPRRDVALSAGADHRRDQLRLVGALDVVGVEAVVVADDDVAAAEREVRVGVARADSGSAAGAARLPAAAAGRRRAERLVRIEEAFGLRQVRHQLHVPRGLGGLRARAARLEVGARIGRRRPRQVGRRNRIGPLLRRPVAAGGCLRCGGCLTGAALLRLSDRDRRSQRSPRLRKLVIDSHRSELLNAARGAALQRVGQRRQTHRVAAASSSSHPPRPARRPRSARRASPRHRAPCRCAARRPCRGRRARPWRARRRCPWCGSADRDTPWRRRGRPAT